MAEDASATLTRLGRFLNQGILTSLAPGPPGEPGPRKPSFPCLLDPPLFFRFLRNDRRKACTPAQCG